MVKLMGQSPVKWIKNDYKWTSIDRSGIWKKKCPNMSLFLRGSFSAADGSLIIRPQWHSWVAMLGPSWPIAFEEKIKKKTTTQKNKLAAFAWWFSWWFSVIGVAYLAHGRQHGDRLSTEACGRGRVQRRALLCASARSSPQVYWDHPQWHPRRCQHLLGSLGRVGHLVVAHREETEAILKFRLIYGSQTTSMHAA